MTYRPSPKDVARDISQLLNILGPDDDAETLVSELTSDHRTLQQSLMREVIWPLLAKWAGAYESNDYDLRNEATVKLAHEIVSNNRPALPLV